MSGLRLGWIRCVLNDVLLDHQPGFACGKKDVQDGLRHLRMNNIGVNGKLNLELVRKVPSSLAGQRHFLSKGDVLICTTNSGKLVGKCAPFDLDGEFAFSNHLTKLRPNSAVESKYLHYQLWLSWKEGAFEHKCKHWVNQSTLPKAELLSTDILLAPRDEQRRIVAKLEKLLSRVNAAQERLAIIPRILKRFRQSVLEQACSGLLTVDWRETQMNAELDPSRKPSTETLNDSEINDKAREFPKTWDVRKFGSVISSIRGGSTAVPQNEPTQFPILRSSSVRPGLVDLDDVKYVQSHDSQNELNYLSDGDLLFTRLSGSLEYVANCGMVRGLKDKRIQYPDRLFCATILPEMSALFYQSVFACPLIRSQITERAKSSAGHQRVSISDITNQVVPVPCLAEQQEIVRRVEALFKTADALEARYLKAKAHVDKLTQSILAKAFRGELVPQNPNDEPASVLLERITSERNGSAGVKRRSRK